VAAFRVSSDLEKYFYRFLSSLEFSLTSAAAFYFFCRHMLLSALVISGHTLNNIFSHIVSNIFLQFSGRVLAIL